MWNWVIAPHPFYLRTGHVSSHRLFTQSTYVIASYLLPSPQHLVLLQVDLSHLPIWDWLVQYENLCIFITHYHQVAALALILWEDLPSIFRFWYRNTFCHVWRIAACLLPYLFTLSTFSIKVRRVFLKYLVCFILKKITPNNSTWPIVFVCFYCCLLALDKINLLFLFVLFPFHEQKQQKIPFLYSERRKGNKC